MVLTSTAVKFAWCLCTSLFTIAICTLQKWSFLVWIFLRYQLYSLRSELLNSKLAIYFSESALNAKWVEIFLSRILTEFCCLLQKRKKVIFFYLGILTKPTATPFLKILSPNPICPHRRVYKRLLYRMLLKKGEGCLRDLLMRLCCLIKELVTRVLSLGYPV